MALPRCAMGLPAVCDCGIPDHTHYFNTCIQSADSLNLVQKYNDLTVGISLFIRMSV